MPSEKFNTTYSTIQELLHPWLSGKLAILVGSGILLYVFIHISPYNYKDSSTPKHKEGC